MSVKHVLGIVALGGMMLVGCGESSTPPAAPAPSAPVKKDAAKAMDGAKEAVKEGAAKTGEVVKEGAEKVKEGAEVVKEKAGEATEAAGEKIEAAGKTIKEEGAKAKDDAAKALDSMNK